MKLFKKKTSVEKITSSKVKVTKLEKNQLEKVSGGTTIAKPRDCNSGIAIG